MRVRYELDLAGAMVSDVRIKWGKFTVEFDGTEVLAGLGVAIWLVGAVVEGFKTYQWVGYALIGIWAVLVVLISLGIVRQPGKKEQSGTTDGNPEPDAPTKPPAS